MGRTGVFITLSIALERMRYEGVVDMFQTVKTLRTQRPAMVQTEVSRPVCGTQVSPPNSPPAVSCTCSWPTCVCSCYSHVALLVLPNLQGGAESELCSFSSSVLSSGVMLPSSGSGLNTAVCVRC